MSPAEFQEIVYRFVALWLLLDPLLWSIMKVSSDYGQINKQECIPEGCVPPRPLNVVPVCIVGGVGPVQGEGWCSLSWGGGGVLSRGGSGVGVVVLESSGAGGSCPGGGGGPVRGGGG